jgi:hypothetical protein
MLAEQRGISDAKIATIVAGSVRTTSPLMRLLPMMLRFTSKRSGMPGGFQSFRREGIAVGDVLVDGLA